MSSMTAVMKGSLYEEELKRKKITVSHTQTYPLLEREWGIHQERERER